MTKPDFEEIRKAVKEMNQKYGGKINIEEWQDIDHNDCLKVVMTWKKIPLSQILDSRIAV